MNNLRAATLAALKAVRTNVAETDSGICANMEIELRRLGFSHLALDANRLIQDMWPRWPKYSGKYMFPVAAGKVPNRTAAAPIYLDNLVPKWGDNSYGNDRRELLDWLIAELELAELRAVTLAALSR